MASEDLQLGKTMKTLEIAMFVRQLSTMIAVGIPLARALEILAESQPTEDSKALLTSLLMKISHGCSLSDAMKSHSGVLSPTLITMVLVGEQTGQISEVLDSAATWMERDIEVYQKVKNALTYPAVVAIISFLLTLGLFAFIVPGLIEILIQSNTPIPILTKVVMGVTRVARNPLCYLALFAVVLQGWVSFRVLRTNRKFMAKVWELLFSIPILGKGLRSAVLSRYAFTSQFLLQSGIPPSRVARLAAEASACALLQVDADRVLGVLDDGGQLSDGLSVNPEVYDPLLIQFIQSGEETAHLSEMMARAASILEQELDTILERVASVIEPFLLLTVGAVVAVTLVSVFQPLYATLQGI